MGKFWDVVKNTANKIVNGILKTVLSPIRPIIYPIEMLSDTMKQLLELIVKIISIIPTLFNIFYEITDPTKMLRDLLHGIFVAKNMIYNAIIDQIFGKLSYKYKISLSDNQDTTPYKACIKPTFVEILILVLCPPLAIFIRKGIKGFMIILITTILTCFYYLPGVIFASFYIL